MPREQADKAMDPAEDNLAAAQVAHSLDPQAEVLDLGQQRTRAEVDKMARQVERKPVVAEESGLKASRIRHGHDKQPTWDKKR